MVAEASGQTDLYIANSDGSRPRLLLRARAQRWLVRRWTVCPESLDARRSARRAGRDLAGWDRAQSRGFRRPGLPRRRERRLRLRVVAAQTLTRGASASGPGRSVADKTFRFA